MPFYKEMLLYTTSATFRDPEKYTLEKNALILDLHFTLFRIENGITFLSSLLIYSLYNPSLKKVFLKSPNYRNS